MGIRTCEYIVFAKDSPESNIRTHQSHTPWTQVTRAAETVEYKMEEVSAVAALHPANDCYGVITMEVNKFREVGEGLGAAMQF